MTRPVLDDPAPKSVLVPFMLASCGGVAFAVSYALDLGAPVLGASIGGAFAFLAFGLVRWSKLVEHEEPVYVEERSLEPSPPREFEAFWQALASQPVPRSRFLWGGLVVALATIGGAAVFPLRSLYSKEGGNVNRILSHTVFHRGVALVTEKGEKVKASDLDYGSIETVFAENGDLEQATTATMLIRVPPHLLQLPARRRSWVVDGVVAYSRYCTHAGCPVGLYADQDYLLMCPCHHSIFNVLDGAQVVSGPAPLPLPQLPIGVDKDGYLIALGDFTTPIGAGFWGFYR